jgi:hypothetical protein
MGEGVVEYLGDGFAAESLLDGGDVGGLVKPQTAPALLHQSHVLAAGAAALALMEPHLLLASRHDGDRHAQAIGTAHAAHAVNVILRLVGQRRVCGGQHARHSAHTPHTRSTEKGGG